MNGWRGVSMLALAAAMFAALPALAQDDNSVRPYSVVDDGIPAPLTDQAGDAARGRGIVVSRQTGLCLLCHSGPFPDQPQQGTLAPTLAGAGSRSTEAQLRLRIVDARRLNPASIMPAYHRVEHLARVGRAWQARPVLNAQQIEDVVAFLRTLREP